MQNKDIEAATKAMIGGIRVMKNELLPPNEIILLVGVDAYERIKNADKLEKESGDE
tara:strand:- start:156 stop:323 length:168 start_codon:yes stop_codon:yes gene_type:complete